MRVRVCVRLFNLFRRYLPLAPDTCFGLLTPRSSAARRTLDSTHSYGSRTQTRGRVVSHKDYYYSLPGPVLIEFVSPSPRALVAIARTLMGDTAAVWDVETRKRRSEMKTKFVNMSFIIVPIFDIIYFMTYILSP